jgi:riboflavin kinase/FMN adenylyltransferase
MKIIEDIQHWERAPIAATTGFFDGVHTGHRFLLDELQTQARAHALPSAVVTFISHPRKTLRSDYSPALLNTYDEKMSLLAATGVDYAFVMDFTPQLADNTAEQFITELLHNALNVKLLLVGYDNRFGRLRSDGYDEYLRFGRSCGMEVVMAEPLRDASGLAVSSSAVRRLLQSGNVADAAKMLGYNYRLQGIVVAGFRQGRQLGFPTANILSDKYKAIPKNGVYAVRVIIADRQYNGMLYIGSRPTFAIAAMPVSIEVNIFDMSENLYGKMIAVEFIDFIRDDAKFDTPENLKRQMEEDKQKVLWRLSTMQ